MNNPPALPDAPQFPAVPRWATTALCRALCTALSLALLGCATPTTPASLPDEGSGCAVFSAALQATVEAHGVTDAESAAIAGLPGLRVDRIGAALRQHITGSHAAQREWLDRAASLDAEARAVELAQLPPAAFPIADAADATSALHRAADCRARLVRFVLYEPSGALRQRLARSAQVPDRYQLGARFVGLYPLTRWPFFAGVLNWQREHTETMAHWARTPPPLQRFVPQDTGRADMPIARSALGLPQLDGAGAAALLAWHAPVFELQQRGHFDHFGTPAWRAGAAAPQVDTTQPVVFQRLSHMLLGGVWRVQLVYALWFPERPARSTLDLLAGQLDGVIVRLTLGEAGEVLLADTIHACGCYHLFFASPALRERAPAPRHQEWLFAPAPLPLLAPSQRLVVRLASGTHYVSGLSTVERGATHGRGYALRAEATLRALPSPEGGTKSLYGPSGLVAGSERAERFFFWPMGITSAGAMRQWGHHATAFVGRRHFDDPELLEERYRLEPSAR